MQKFQLIFDINLFLDFVSDILFVSKINEHLRRLFFQLQNSRKVLIQRVTTERYTGLREQISFTLLLKEVFHKLDDDTMSEVKYFMSCGMAFLVSEAIVESWGSVIDSMITSKIGFKKFSNVESSRYPLKIE